MKLFKKIFGLNADNNENQTTQNTSTAEEAKATMSEEKFWAIIQSAVDLSDGTYYEIYYKLDDLLNEMEAEDVLKFQDRYNYFIIRGCTPKMYGASRLLVPPTSEIEWNEQELIELLESIIAKGNKFYYDTIDNPDHLAQLDDFEFSNEIHYMVQDVLYDKGVSYENNLKIDEKLIDEIKLEETQLPELLPQLWAKYLPERLKVQNKKNKIKDAAKQINNME